MTGAEIYCKKDKSFLGVGTRFQTKFKVIIGGIVETFTPGDGLVTGCSLRPLSSRVLQVIVRKKEFASEWDLC